MYALFENNTFIKLIAAIDAETYQLENKYMLYKLEATKLPFHIDNYNYAIVNSKLLAYIPDENIVVAKIGKTSELTEEEEKKTWNLFFVAEETKLQPDTLWQKFKSWLGF